MIKYYRVGTRGRADNTRAVIGGPLADFKVDPGTVCSSSCCCEPKPFRAHELSSGMRPGDSPLGICKVWSMVALSCLEFPSFLVLGSTDERLLPYPPSAPVRLANMGALPE